MESSKYHRSIDLLEADLNEELVALDPQEGNCFGFNEAATSVWRLLETPQSFDELKAALLVQYDVDDDTCAADLRELLEELQTKGLISKLETR